MTVTANEVQDSIKITDEVINDFHAKPQELIPILMKLNLELGFLSPEVLERISARLHIPSSRVYSIASFYHMIYTKPTGRHVVKFCESAPCHVAGGREVWKALQKEMGIKPGETSKDGRWTLFNTSCLGVCAVGPVMMVDEDIYGNLSPDQLPNILAKYP